LPQVLFLLIGEGADKARLVSKARRLSLDNVRFLPLQPRQKIPAYIRASDACLVILKKRKVFKTVIPTKMLEFFASGRPVILGVDGQARDVLEAAEAGIFIPPEDVEELVRAVERLYRDKKLRQTLGKNGRQYVVNNLSRSQTAHQYINVLRHSLENS
jgi:glycosyltransferase involved in cell wall biosynthesis